MACSGRSWERILLSSPVMERRTGFDFLGWTLAIATVLSVTVLLAALGAPRKGTRIGQNPGTTATYVQTEAPRGH